VPSLQHAIRASGVACQPAHIARSPVESARIATAAARCLANLTTSLECWTAIHLSNPLRRGAERYERGRVDRPQATRGHATEDDCLHPVDSVHADDFCPCDDAELITIGPRGLEKVPAKTSRSSRVIRMQDDQNALAALESADGSGASGSSVAGDDEIDGHDHSLSGSAAVIVPGDSRVASAPGAEIERSGQCS